ncbi:hypothetical protein CBL_13587 [Carabus blaptoides fortunei]
MGDIVLSIKLLVDSRRCTRTRAYQTSHTMIAVSYSTYVCTDETCFNLTTTTEYYAFMSQRMVSRRGARARHMVEGISNSKERVTQMGLDNYSSNGNSREDNEEEKGFLSAALHLPSRDENLEIISHPF